MEFRTHKWFRLRTENQGSLSNPIAFHKALQPRSIQNSLAPSFLICFLWFFLFFFYLIDYFGNFLFIKTILKLILIKAYISCVKSLYELRIPITTTTNNVKRNCQFHLKLLYTNLMNKNAIKGLRKLVLH